MKYKFSETEPAAGGSYIKPGYYKAKPTKVELGNFPAAKTPYLGVTLTTDSGIEHIEKFVLSEKALGRLQYLHLALFNKKLEKDFADDKALLAYFQKVLLNPKAPVTRVFVFGGQIDGDKVYASLPFTNFIVPKDEEDGITEGEFEEGDADWKKYVSKRKSEVSSEKSGHLNDADDDDDLPSKKSTGKGSGKGSGNKAGWGEKETSDDDDDLPF